MQRGYTKAYRKELDSQIWLMPPIYHRVWFALRQKARHAKECFPTKRGFGINLNPGQIITSIDQICRWVSWTEWGVEKTPNKKTISVVLVWLESNGMVTVESNATGTFINIVNWDTYNGCAAPKVTESNQALVTENKRLLETVKELQELQSSKKKEEKPLGDKPPVSGPSRNLFEIFWEEYPKKKAKGAAEKAFMAAKITEGFLPVVVAAIRAQKKTHDWTKDKGQFIPHPATWLRAKQWADEIETGGDSKWE